MMEIAFLFLGLFISVLLAEIISKLKQIAELIKGVADNLDEVESTIERVNR